MEERRRRITLRYEGKFFLYGVIFGLIFNFLWMFYYYSNINIFLTNNLDKNIEIYNEKLVKYINGKWESSIGDIQITISTENNRPFIVLENLTEKKSETHYQIFKLRYVNGVLGIIKFDVCPLNFDCNKNSNYLIPIQINNIFDIKDAIDIAYDSRITYCTESSDLCIRAFKRISSENNS